MPTTHASWSDIDWQASDHLRGIQIWTETSIVLLLYYVLATSEVISRRTPTCDSAHLCHVDFTVLPHWKARPSAPCHAISPSHIILTLGQTVRVVVLGILMMPSTWQGNENYQFHKSWVRTHDLPYARPMLYQFNLCCTWAEARPRICPCTNIALNGGAALLSRHEYPLSQVDIPPDTIIYISRI